MLVYNVTSTPAAVSGRETAEAQPLRTEDGQSMADVLAAVAGAERAADPAGRSIKEYRSYIMECISALRVDPSQSESSTVVRITDEGFAAMKADPEYEQWVMDTLRVNFASVDPWSDLCGGHYNVHTFGATKEEYHGEAWFPAYMGGQGTAMFESAAADACWARLTDTAGSNRRASDERTSDRLFARLRLERMLQKMALEHRRQQSELLEHASLQRAMTERAHRTGQNVVGPAAPLPYLKGVPAAYLLAMLGGGM